MGRYITENNLKLNLDHFDFLLDPPLKRIRNIWRELKKSGKAEIKVTAVDAPAANDKAIADVAADEKSSVRRSVEEGEPLRGNVPYEMLGVLPPPDSTEPGNDIQCIPNLFRIDKKKKM